MNITIRMSPEEYDAYRAYQKEKASLELEVGRLFNEVKRAHENVCNAILSSVKELPESTEETPLFEIVDSERLASALDLANEWFC